MGSITSACLTDEHRRSGLYLLERKDRLLLMRIARFEALEGKEVRIELGNIH